MGRTSDAEERLVEQAALLWHARSYADVGVNEICDAAGVRKGSFYHFFASKRDLALAVIDDQHRRRQEYVVRPAMVSDSPMERLRLMVENALADLRRQTERLGVVSGCPFGNLAVELSTIDEVVRARLDDLFEHQVATIRRELEEAVAVGEIPPDTDADTSARALLAYFEGVMAASKAASDVSVAERLAPLGLRLVGPAITSPVAV